MAYQINKTDGTLLVQLVDGSIDTATTDISLIGRNYSGFGESINEYFVKMLENFANTAAPSIPLTGQLWWDKSEARLKVWNGTQFTSAGGPIVSSSQPTMVAGDLWIDNLNNQLYFYDGSDLELAGPLYSSTQKRSGFKVETLQDSQNLDRVVIKFFLGGTLVGVYSNVAFTPRAGSEITGLTGVLQKGFTLVESDFKIHGTATAADTIINAQGIKKNASQFMPTDADAVSNGSITTINNSGVIVGPENNIQILIDANQSVIQNNVSNRDIFVKVRKSTGFENAMHIDSSESRIGIFKTNPIATLDINGSTRISGDLTVLGNTISVESQTLKIVDKNIELALGSDSTLLTDSQVDDGGILIRATPDDKEFLWKNATNSWTANVNYDSTKGYKFNGNEMITQVGSTPTMKHIQSAPDLTNVGTLTSLVVDNTTIDGTTISTGSGNPLTFTSDGPITISNSQTIRGLPTPSQATDAASKSYVDDTVNGERVSFSLDITGLSDAQILLVVEDIAPASTKKEGTQAYLHCTSTTGATATFSASTLNNALSKTTTAVDKTITASPQTVVSVVKQANTRLTLGGTHGYEGGQSVTISGATGLTALNGTHTISNIIDAQTIEINLNTASDGNTYTGSSATIERVPVTGNENQSVVSDFTFSQAVGSVVLTLARSVKICTISGGVWTGPVNGSSSV